MTQTKKEISTVKTEDQKLIELAEKHERYVNELKKALIVGQVGFLKAGEILHLIKKEETYKAEDSAHEWSWDNFLARPDLPIPGSTLEGQKRNAQRLVKLYRLFMIKLGKTEGEIADIGYSKLSLIATPIEKSKEKERDNVVAEWFDKARTLTVKALYAEIKGGGKEIGEGIECPHTDEYPMFYCPGCGARSRKPMNKNHKEIPENIWKK